MIDRDRVYEPEQFGQLARDLVAARRQKLDPFEAASLNRWKREGRDARIRRLNDGKLTCWPVDLPTSPGPSHIQGKRTTAHDAMAFLRGEKDYGVSVGIRFDSTDLDLLRAAAITEKDNKLFLEAAASIERNSYLVVRCMSAEELQAIVKRLAKAGVPHVTIDTLRVGDTKPVRV
jgi:hypothetical protein